MEARGKGSITEKGVECCTQAMFDEDSALAIKLNNMEITGNHILCIA